MMQFQQTNMKLIAVRFVQWKLLSIAKHMGGQSTQLKQIKLSFSNVLTIFELFSLGVC